MLSYLYDTRGEDVRRIFLMLYALLLLFVSVALAGTKWKRELPALQESTQSISSQTAIAINQERINELGQRVQNLEHNQLGERLVRVEQTVEDDHHLIMLIAGALLVMMIEALFRLVSVGRNLMARRPRES